MRIFEVNSILLVCLLHASSSSDDFLYNSNSFMQCENLTLIDDNSRLHQSATDTFFRIASNVQIGSNCLIGNSSKINDDVIICNNVEIDNNATIDYGVIIEDNSKIKRFVKLEPNVKIASNNFINSYSIISYSTQIKNDSILDLNVLIGSNSIVEQHSYIGMYGKIGSNVQIGKNVVIHLNAFIPNNAIVEKNDVIIKTPLSIDLYADSLPLRNVPFRYIHHLTASNSHLGSRSFNNDMRSFIENQINRLNKCCQYQMPIVFEKMPLIKSVYLLQFHGINNFDYIQNSIIGIDHERLVLNDNGYLNELYNEYHFVYSSSKHILEPDIRDQFVQLLALEQDAQRAYRHSDDTFCKMFMEIATRQRNVKCDQEILVFQ